MASFPGGLSTQKSQKPDMDASFSLGLLGYVCLKTHVQSLCMNSPLKQDSTDGKPSVQ